MQVAYIDFETYSACNLKIKGGMNYATHPSTDLVCLAWTIDDGPVDLITTSQAVYRKTLPRSLHDHVINGGIVIAHTATFDFRIWNYVCVRLYGWPALSLGQMIDSMALCSCFQLPASLAGAGEALGISMPKDADGKRLIKLCCTPTKAGLRPVPSVATQEVFNKLYNYCIRDVEAMRQIVQALPRTELIPIEQKIWELTYEMNTFGVPIDYQAIVSIRDAVSKYIEHATLQVPQMCGYAFETVNQIAKIKEWAEGCYDYYLPTLDAAAVSTALADDDCPEPVKAILMLRQELGRSSTAKYAKLAAQAGRRSNQWYVYDNLVYHGAGTGRWAGRGFQLHNLPRASVKEPEVYIEKFITGDFVENPVGVAKALIRPMIKVQDDEDLVVSDYSSIENKVLHWLANDVEALEDFAKGIDQYITMAAVRYGVTYEHIVQGREAGDKQCSAMRQMGKVIILGAGFGMGHETFVETAQVQFGLTVPPDEAKLAINAYREKYYMVKQLWNELKLAAVRAVLSGQSQTYHLITFGTATVKGIRWLAMKLPSGKCIYYMDPRVDQMYIPKFESMGRVPTITHAAQNPYTKKWGRSKLIPGRITENAVQGTAREMMAQGLLNVKKNLPQVQLVGCVHDEGLGVAKKGTVTIEEFNHELCSIPWAQGCPITTEGWLGPRYKK